MKKIRLLLTALASMLAIGSYAQTTEEWVAAAKAALLSTHPHFGEENIISPTDRFVFYQGFSFIQGNDVEPNYHLLRNEKEVVKLDRTKSNMIASEFACALFSNDKNPNLNIPELQGNYKNTLTRPYEENSFNYDYLYYVKQNIQNFTFMSKSLVGDTKDVYRNLDKGGIYELEINYPGHSQSIELTVQSDAECRLDVVTDEDVSYKVGNEARIEIAVASGYPYKEHLADYQGKNMKLLVYDAKNEKVDEKTFTLNATQDRLDLEYTFQVEYRFTVKSIKYTFKLSGGPLTKELVFTKEVEPEYDRLNAAIEEANALIDQIMTDPDKAHFAMKANQLKSAVEQAKNSLSLKADKQKEIDKAATDLEALIFSVKEYINKKTVEVYNATQLQSAINDDNAAHILLKNDIDMSGVDATLCQIFSGTIDGSKDPSQPDGETYALIGRENNPNYSSNKNSNSLFEGVADACFTNITFKYFRIEKDEHFLGVICGVANNTKFQNITMEGVTVDCKKSTAGTITGAALNCVFDHIYITGSVVFANASIAGSIAGFTTACELRDCFNDSGVGVWAQGSEDEGYPAFSGGFSGRSSSDLFENCENHAFVGGNRNCIGGIAAGSFASTFIDCINEGLIVSCERDHFGNKYNVLYHIEGNSVGGICGFAESSSIERCCNNAQVGQEKNAQVGQEKSSGGIVGKAVNGEINNCLNTTNGNGWLYNGIIGEDDNCKITNCLCTANIDIVGNIKKQNPQSGNNYSRMKWRDRPLGYEMEISEEQMRSGIVARWLNNGIQNRKEGVEPWRQNVELQGSETETDSHPVLDPAHRVVTLEYLTRGTVITNDKELLAFAERVNGGDQFACARLDADIDMTNIDWTPIGKNEDSKHFRGIFDGQGHKIIGLEYFSNTEAAGFFGAVHNNAEIRNVIIGEGSKFTSTGDAGAGGIVGVVYSGWCYSSVIIENCGSHADISVNKHGGGILGRIDSPNDNNVRVYVSNCYSMGTVMPKNGNSALLCGYTKNHGVVTGCWSGGQLRSHKDYPTILPYSIEQKPETNKYDEYLVGYDERNEVSNCFLLNPGKNIDVYRPERTQKGVDVADDESIRSGEFAYKLNNGVTDGTQGWYQEIGRNPSPVYTKLPDGTNIVYRIEDSEGNILGYGNTSHEEISKVILGIWDFEDHRVTDVNKSGDVDVTDVTTFTKAATMK